MGIPNLVVQAEEVDHPEHLLVLEMDSDLCANLQQNLYVIYTIVICHFLSKRVNRNTRMATVLNYLSFCFRLHYRQIINVVNFHDSHGPIYNKFLVSFEMKENFDDYFKCNYRLIIVY